MISRLWHGWTTLGNADAYETLLKKEIFVGIAEREIAGYRGIHLLRRDLGDEVESVTVMWFDSLEAVRAFAGEDYEVAVVPPQRSAFSMTTGRKPLRLAVIAPSNPAAPVPTTTKSKAPCVVWSTVILPGSFFRTN